MQSFLIQAVDDGLRLEPCEVPVPEPAAGQVLVRMRAAGLNRGEFLLAPGQPNSGPPRAVGVEGAGEVVKLGLGVTGIDLGARVMGRCSGAFAELALMDERELLPVPKRLSWEQAGGTPTTFMVAHDMLVAKGRLRAGEWLLITGASSGVGVATLQVAKTIGAKVAATSGSAEKLARLEAFGLDVPLCTREPTFGPAVRAATSNHGANVVINIVGGSMFPECLRALAYEGRLAVVGWVDRVLDATIDLDLLHSKRLEVFGLSNKLRSTEHRAESARGLKADILPALADGRIVPLVDRIFDFHDLPQAKAYMESNEQLGKIVLRMPAGG